MTTSAALLLGAGILFAAMFLSSALVECGKRAENVLERFAKVCEDAVGEARARRKESRDRR